MPRSNSKDPTDNEISATAKSLNRINEYFREGKNPSLKLPKGKINVTKSGKKGGKRKTKKMRKSKRKIRRRTSKK